MRKYGINLLTVINLTLCMKGSKIDSAIMMLLPIIFLSGADLSPAEAAKIIKQKEWLKKTAQWKLQMRWEGKVCIKSLLQGEHWFQGLTTLKIIITHGYFTVISLWDAFDINSLNIPLDFILFSFLCTLAMHTNTHVASMTTPTPAGLTASVRAMAICFVRRSWTIRAIKFRVYKGLKKLLFLHFEVIIGMQCNACQELCMVATDISFQHSLTFPWMIRKTFPWPNKYKMPHIVAG